MGKLVSVGLGVRTLISMVEGAMAENGWMERLKALLIPKLLRRREKLS